MATETMTATTASDVPPDSETEAQRMDDWALRAERIRIEMLFEDNDPAVEAAEHAPMAEQHLLLGLAALGTAEHHFKLAALLWRQVGGR